VIPRLARVFYRRRVHQAAVNLRLAQVFHRRRVYLIAVNLRLAPLFHRRRVHSIAVNLGLARLFHRRRDWTFFDPKRPFETNILQIENALDRQVTGLALPVKCVLTALALDPVD
jgi:hypothetical protein